MITMHAVEPHASISHLQNMVKMVMQRITVILPETLLHHFLDKWTNATLDEFSKQ